ncbi:MAG: dihydropteroate synthase [Actinobacteria bacterium]|nr:dihydropteroate synthase [Actinomycetota bacterium]NBY14869.1 dihydropteroate synthase [Actinomycetota bacterium]
MRRHPAGLPETLTAINRTLVMGVINVTSDSFSDGGKFASVDSAIKHAHYLTDSGADLVDVGGESTRPGAQRVSLDEELSRVMPVVTKLVSDGIVVSVDTMRAEVAKQAIAAGVHLINDVSGGLADSGMFSVIAQSEVPYIMMHWRAHSAEMMEKSHYFDVVNDVTAELLSQVNKALSAGIASEHIVLDPGLGFAKLPEQNWPLLSRINELQELGYPILIGASRKRFLGELLAQGDKPRDVLDREAATIAVSALMAHADVWALRVHDCRTTRDAVAVVEQLRRS